MSRGRAGCVSQNEFVTPRAMSKLEKASEACFGPRFAYAIWLRCVLIIGSSLLGMLASTVTDIHGPK